MRLLLVTHIYFPEASAGVETYSRELLRACPAGHEVGLATTRKVISKTTGEWQKNSLDDRPLYEAINNLDHEGFQASFRQAAMEQAFSEILDDFQPDVVHFQHLMYWSVDLPALARSRGIRVFLTLHDFWLMCPRLGQLVDWSGELCHLPELSRCATCLEHTKLEQTAAAKAWIRRLGTIRRWTGIALDDPMRRLFAWRSKASGSRALTAEEPSRAVDLDLWAQRLGGRQEAVKELVSSLDGLITPSVALAEKFQTWGLKSDVWRILKQGRDHAPYRGLGKKEENSRLRLAFIGTIAPHKGVLELIEAMKGLDPEAIELAIYGPFKQHADYEARCRAAADVETTCFLGPVPRDQVPGLYSKIDLLAVPSLWDECCPLTIQEAFMAGVPVLASRLGGMTDLLKSGGGALLGAGDVKAWHEELRALIEAPERLLGYQTSIPAVATMEEHWQELEALYRGS